MHQILADQDRKKGNSEAASLRRATPKMANTVDKDVVRPIEERVKKNIEHLRNDIDNLESTLVVAEENGLFKFSQNSEAHKVILDRMVEACEVLDDSKKSPETRFIESWPKYREATYQLNEALNTAPGSWRFIHLYGGPFALYYCVMLAVVFSAWVLFNPLMLDTKIFWVPTYAYVWGLIGGILQGLWFLWQHVSDRQLRKVWIPWYILLPLIGGLLGALTYLIFLAGFITSTGATQIESEYFTMLLCALAGFSSKWAVETLDKIVDLIKIG